MSEPHAFNSRRWIGERSEFWRRVERETPALLDNKPIDAQDLRRAMLDYPELARDLAIARTHAANSPLTAQIERLYRALHRAIHHPARWRGEDLRRFLKFEVPETTHALRWHIFSTAVGFVLASVLGWLLVSTYPEMAALFASEQMIDTVQRGELWTDGLLNVMPSSLLSIEVFTNNVLVSLTAMSLGILYGLGTIYIIGLNGMMLGCVFAFVHQYSMSDELFSFVVAHGFVELSIIAIAGAVGFSLGEALARPGNRTRMAAFQAAVRRGGRYMLLMCVFMVGAGIIEGYVSPNPAYPLWARLFIGLAYWVFFLYVITGGGRLLRGAYTRRRDLSSA